MKLLILSFLLVILPTKIFSQNTSYIIEDKSPISFLKVKNGKFINSKGEEIILNGINHVVKDPQKNYLNVNDSSLFLRFKQLGFNCIRYGIHWDGLEPEPGKINQKYLEEIDKRVRWAEENQIWLILDMHQDLYSRKFSNGAPLWATLDEGLPHQSGTIWSDAYLISPAVQRAFDNFWSNKPATDGMGIQDHYINLWKILATRYAQSPAVAGFDVMNEPFPGSLASKIFEELLTNYATALAQQGKHVPSYEELAASFNEETSRMALLQQMDNKELFQKIVTGSHTTMKHFEEDILSPFYQKIRDAIRAAGSQQVIFLEHSYFCNMGIPSSFHVPVYDNGQPDANCAYAPHAYDLVTDTSAGDSPGYNRTEVIYEQVFKNGTQKQLPVWIGEWGAFYMGKNYLQPAKHIIQMIERQQAGQSYWCWWENIETQDYFHQALVRPYPMCVQGKLIQYSNKGADFTCEWASTGSSSQIKIFIPNLHAISPDKIIAPQGCSFQIIRPHTGWQSGYLLVQSTRPTTEIRIKDIHPNIFS